MFWLDFGARGRENIANNAVLFLVGTENTVNYNVLCSLWYLGGGPCGAEKMIFSCGSPCGAGKVIISCPTGTPCGAEKGIISCPTGAEKMIISCPTWTPCGAEKMIISCPTGNYLTWRRRRRRPQQQQQQQQQHQHQHQHHHHHQQQQQQQQIHIHKPQLRSCAREHRRLCEAHQYDCQCKSVGKCKCISTVNISTVYWNARSPSSDKFRGIPC